MAADPPLWFTITTSSITTAATVVAVVAGLLGLSTWKKQLRNTEDHTMSRELLRAAYNLRDGFAIIRSPFIYIRERDDAGNLLSPERRHDERMKIYGERIKETGTRRSTLEVKITEADALWGEPVRSWCMPLIERHAELVSSVRTVLDSESPQTSDVVRAQYVELFAKARGVANSLSFSEPDEFDTNVALALDTIREHLKPKMIVQ